MHGALGPIPNAMKTAVVCNTYNPSTWAGRSGVQGHLRYTVSLRPKIEVLRGRVHFESHMPLGASGIHSADVNAVTN